MKDHGSHRGSRFEVSTNSRDPSLQLVFSDPSPGSLTQLGLSIPAAVPAYYPQTWANRYLALLVSVSFTYGQAARLVGMRQRVLIGETLTQGEDELTYNVYTAQTTPDWHFSDGNIAWMLRRVPLGRQFTASPSNTAELQFRSAQTPAILFENPPGVGNGYAPPNGGMPPGDVLIPDLGCFHDLRFPWQGFQAWDSLDIEIRGPCRVELYASIRQTNPESRPALASPSTAQLAVLPPEEQFIAQYTNAVYTRIAGSLIFERASLYPIPEAPEDCFARGRGNQRGADGQRVKRKSTSGPSRTPKASSVGESDDIAGRKGGI